MKLITEMFEDVEVLNETNSQGVKSLYIEGVFAQAETPNRNRRTYPVNILEREITKFNENFVKTRRALGELEHPESPQINPRNVSHRITELKRVGNDFVGKAIILDTPAGQIARGILEGGTVIGVSTRGMGSVSEGANGISVINEDFKLVTVDIVTNPSGIDCFVNGILEGVEWRLDESGVYSQVERQKTFKKAEKLISEKAKMAVLVDFIGKIGNRI